MGFPHPDERVLWQEYTSLNRRRRRALLMRARKRVSKELAAGTSDYEVALQRSIVGLMREEQGHPDSARGLFHILDDA